MLICVIPTPTLRRARPADSKCAIVNDGRSHSAFTTWVETSLSVFPETSRSIRRVKALAHLNQGASVRDSLTLGSLLRNKFIRNSSHVAQAAARRESDITQHIFSTSTTHANREYVREVFDSFEVEGPGGKYLYMAFKPLRQPLWMLGR